MKKIFSFITNKNNKGFTTIAMLVIIGGLIPIIFFTSVDLTHFMQVNAKLNNTTNNIGSSLSTSCKKGSYDLNYEEMNKITNEMLKENLNLEDDLSPKEKSVLYNKPKVDIKILNNVKSGKKVSGTVVENRYVDKPSIKVDINYPVQGLFFKSIRVNIKNSVIKEIH